ncbi:MAG: hypothetical protein KC503_01055 [Myxococcales bacterium]|nr:hypothetical protein [Myxococcales bacterium]
MSFRDEQTALREQNEALERERDEAQRARERLAEQLAKAERERATLERELANAKKGPTPPMRQWARSVITAMIVGAVAFGITFGVIVGIGRTPRARRRARWRTQRAATPASLVREPLRYVRRKSRFMYPKYQRQVLQVLVAEADNAAGNKARARRRFERALRVAHKSLQHGQLARVIGVAACAADALGEPARGAALIQQARAVLVGSMSYSEEAETFLDVARRCRDMRRPNGEVEPLLARAVQSAAKLATGFKRDALLMRAAKQLAEIGARGGLDEAATALRAKVRRYAEPLQLAQLAQLYAKVGDKGKARALLDVGDYGASTSAWLQAERALAYAALGEAKLARAALARAEESIRVETSTATRGKARASVARAWVLLGEPQRAEKIDRVATRDERVRQALRRGDLDGAIKVGADATRALLAEQLARAGRLREALQRANGVRDSRERLFAVVATYRLTLGKH